MDNKIYIQDLSDSGKPKGNPEMAQIGSMEDGSVMKMFSIGKKLYALKQSSLYELKTKNPQIKDEGNKASSEPTVIQKLVINKGPDSDFVAKTLLTAKSVFQHGHFDENIREEIFKLCIETLFEFSSLLEAVENYNSIELVQINNFKLSPKSKENFVLPSIPDIKTRAKTIFQKTDQISQHLISIIQLFYPPRKNAGTPYEQLYEYFNEKYGKDDPYSQYLNANLLFFCHIRFIRNGLDHTKASFVIIEDFKFEHNKIIYPTISLDKKECKLEAKRFKEYINDVLIVYPYIFENILIMLADDNIKNNAFAFRIRLIPKDKRIFQQVRYAFWSPIGENGFYNLNM